MKTLGLLLLTVSFCITGLHAQSSPQPSRVPGRNRVVFERSDSTVAFLLNNQVLYRYSVRAAGPVENIGATLGSLTAVAANGTTFRPSNVGGIRAELGGKERAPWDPEVRFRRLGYSGIRDSSVRTRWRMSDTRGNAISYSLTFTISGRTLSIDVAVEGGSDKATGFDFDRCENAAGARIVKVPYLTLFNLLYSNASANDVSDGVFTSLFFDWEATHASVLQPYESYEYRYSSTSLRFTQTARYGKKTDGKRNPLRERIYLTVSGNLHDVLPDLPGPIAPYKDKASSWTVLSYSPPFPWIMNPCCGYDYNYLQRISDLEVKNLAVIIKQYQRFGADIKLPDVLPANSFESMPCGDYEAGGKGGTANLRRLRNWIVDTLGYAFALHENYMDFYPDALSHLSEKDCAVSSTGTMVTGWRNCQGTTAHTLKSTRAGAYADRWSTKLRDAIRPTWSYLDVHSALNPSEKVDYDASVPGAGKFTTVLRNYRAIPALLRKKYNGPVQGEGINHFLYAGYFDDFEARLHTADRQLYGHKAPLLVDFDLLKMHPKSARHGVGHYEMFFAPTADAAEWSIATEDVLTYVATELAFGHGGLISKHNIEDQSIDHVVLEYTHVVPMQISYSKSVPISIEYWNGEGEGPYTTSAYIALHPEYDDIGNTRDFMGRVKVTYMNGTVVCVNRSEAPWRVYGVGVSGGWFTRNVEEAAEPVAGISTSTSFTLRARNGWVGYVPR